LSEMATIRPCDEKGVLITNPSYPENSSGR
jgi:hypothetical protein